MIVVIPGLKPPRGLAEIRAFYEWTDLYMRADGSPSAEWTAKMVTVDLPAPLRLSFAPKVVVRRYTVHRKIAPIYLRAFSEIHSRGLWDFMGPFAGGYTWRTQRGSALKLSMHAFGAATDHDPKNNPMRTPPKDCRMDPKVVEVMKLYGFTWGGNFKRPDCMHFQWGGGY